MAPIRPDHLFIFLWHNDFDGVKKLLDDGMDPNTSFHGIGIPRLDHNISRNITPQTILVRNRDNSFHASPLHIAILNCYHNCNLAKSSGNKALSIVLELLQRGADRKANCPGGITLTNFGGEEGNWTVCESEEMTPSRFATFLAANRDYRRDKYIKQKEMLCMVKKELAKTPSPNQHVGYRKPPSTTVLQSVVNTYDKLLFSEHFSDVKFVCSDGSILPGHRCILAAASPYFNTAFQGPWEENHSGEWKTRYPADIMKAVLSLIYRGNYDSAILGLDPFTFLSVASEFQLQSLLIVAEDALVRQLDASNVKETLQVAHLHDNAVLKQACFQFVRTNATSLLMDLKIASLATENPELWAEMGEAISPRSNSENRENKRARLN